MTDETQSVNETAPPEEREVLVQLAPDVDQDRDGIDLTLRFLVGLMSLGGEEADRRLQQAQRKLDQDPSLWKTTSTGIQRPMRHQAWYLGIGLMKRGQKGLRYALRTSFGLSLRAAARVSSTSQRWGISYFARPVTGPIEARLTQWRQEADLIALEGELEDQQGRALALGTLAALIVEVMDEVAENPQMLEFVEDLLGSQGKGMASSMMDNARSVTLTADDAADGLLRWLLRRKPRRELPTSPVAGQSQTMYAPTAKVDGGGPDDE